MQGEGEEKERGCWKGTRQGNKKADFWSKFPPRSRHSKPFPRTVRLARRYSFPQLAKRHKDERVAIHIQPQKRGVNQDIPKPGRICERRAKLQPKRKVIMNGRGESMRRSAGYTNWETRLRQYPGKNRLNRLERIPLLGSFGTFPTNTFYSC